MVILISNIRNSTPQLFKYDNRETVEVYLTKWIYCIQKREFEKALILAKMICDDSFQNSTPADYLELLKLFNLSSTQITSPFNLHDVKRWYDAFECAKIAKELTQNQGQFSLNLLNYFNKKFKLIRRESPLDAPLYLYEILTREELTNNEMLRLASEIAFQAGFEPLIITLHNEKHEQLHALLEVKKGNDLAIIDFKNNLFCEIRSIRDLLEESEKSKTLNSIFSTAKFARYHIPAEVADYKAANTRFYKIISLNKGDVGEIPVFGMEPIVRLKKAISEGKKNGIPATLFAYWHYPFFIFSEHEKFLKNRQISP